MLRLAAHNMDPCFLLLPESIFPVAKDAILYAQQSTLLLVGLALSFLLGTFITKEDILTALVNVVTLGMSFLCGVFVPLDIMGKGVKTMAHFLPVYWYEISNNLLNNSAVLTQAQRQLLYRNYGIQLLFAAAIFCIALVVSKRMRQTA